MDGFRPIIFFGFMTFVLLGLVPLAEFMLAAGGDDLAEVAARASEATGLVWTSNLLVVLRMSTAEPALLALLLGSMAPALAAVLTLAFVKRPKKWSSFFGRLNPVRETSLRTALIEYARIFVLLIPVLFAALYLRQLTGGQYVGSLSSLSLAAVTTIIALAFLDQGAVLEEMGWRGFADPELQRTMTSPLRVALAIGVFWGLWHVPRDLTTGVLERLGPTVYMTLYLPSFLMGTISVSIIASYFMGRLGGSVIPAIMVHGIANDSAGISGSVSIVEALTPYHQFTKNSLLAIVALAVVVVAGSSLGRQSPK